MEKEPFLITTPIYYANGQPHIGHAYTTIAADILARLEKAREKDVFLLTGTDEHGTKVAETAAAVGKQPQDFVDGIADSFKGAWKNLNIEFNDFIRTTDSRHEEGVIYALNILKEKGVVYEKVYKGLYCTGCEAFVTEKDLDEKGLGPLHKKKPIEVEEKNWFFKLTDYLPKIKKVIEDGELIITPTERKNEVLGLLAQGIEDFSLSRSRERVKWGIPLPFDPLQTTYVWIDALLNYVTALGYGSKNWNNLYWYWPAEVQVIGQDILKFHAIYWPAILLALDLPLPKRLLVHGYFTINGQKMSKSLGNVLDPNELVAEFGADVVRYTVMRAFPFGASGDVGKDTFVDKYNELANNIGNLVRRTFNLAEKNGVKFSQLENVEFLEPGDLVSEKDDLSTLLDKILTLAKKANGYLDVKAPWKETNEDRKKESINVVMNGIKYLSETFQPVMPETSKKILGSFGDDGVVTNPPILFPKKEN